MTKETKQKISNAKKGRKWITNTKQNKFIDVKEYVKYETLGYHFGFTKYNKGENNA